MFRVKVRVGDKVWWVRVRGLVTTTSIETYIHVYLYHCLRDRV